MPTIGQDCHLTLQHPTVIGGAAVGFILKADRRGPVLSVDHPRQGLPVWADQGGGQRVTSCTVLALPRLLAPNGSEYSLTPAQVRVFLDAFWATTTPMTLADAQANAAVMWAANGLTERRYTDGLEYDLTFLTL